MTKWIGTGGRVALAVCATVGLAPDCLAQFAATEQPPEQRDAQQRPAEQPPGKQRSSIAVPVVPAQPVTIIGNPGHSRRGPFDTLPKPALYPDTRPEERRVGDELVSTCRVRC